MGRGFPPSPSRGFGGRAAGDFLPATGRALAVPSCPPSSVLTRHFRHDVRTGIAESLFRCCGSEPRSRRFRPLMSFRHSNNYAHARLRVATAEARLRPTGGCRNGRRICGSGPAGASRTHTAVLQTATRDKAGQHPSAWGNACVPRGAWLIRHPADNPDHVHAVVYDDKRPGTILAVGRVPNR